MRRKEIDILLDSLDKSANSNSYWITLAINEETDQFIEDIVQHLKMGGFYLELVKEHLNRGFNDSPSLFRFCFTYSWRIFGVLKPFSKTFFANLR